MKKPEFLAIFAALLFASHTSAMAAKVRTSLANEAQQCQAFLDALKNENAIQLATFGVPLMKRGKLFDYDQELIQVHLKPVLSQDNLTCSVTDRVDGGIIRIMIYPARFAHQIQEQDMEFLKSQYGKNYFACEFSTISGKWKSVPNLCFNETHGPFEAEPD
jgi:hypothetical protein